MQNNYYNSFFDSQIQHAGWNPVKNWTEETKREYNKWYYNQNKDKYRDYYNSTQAQRNKLKDYKTQESNYRKDAANKQKILSGKTRISNASKNRYDTATSNLNKSKIQLDVAKMNLDNFKGRSLVDRVFGINDPKKLVDKVILTNTGYKTNKRKRDQAKRDYERDSKETTKAYNEYTSAVRNMNMNRASYNRENNQYKKRQEAFANETAQDKNKFSNKLRFAGYYAIELAKRGLNAIKKVFTKKKG